MYRRMVGVVVAMLVAATVLASPAMAQAPVPPAPAPAPAGPLLAPPPDAGLAAPDALAMQAVAAPLESSAEEKVRAAAVVGVVAPDSWLVLNDRDFVFRIWQSATGPEVRAGAELALAAGTSAGCVECTVFIRSSIHDAQSRDIANEVRDATAARIAREAKQRAAATVGIVASPEMLILSDRDFVFAIYQQATGPRVKDAALLAFGGTAADQAAFIATGIDAAHAQDQQDRIDADQQASEAEKERLRARDVRARAAAVLGIVATEEIHVLSDDNFLRLILDRSAPASEVEAAALSALRNPSAVARTAFITTGIHEANQRDIDNVLRARAAEDRRLLGELRQRAVNSHLRVALATAAAQALAGSDDDVATFLRVGQYQHLTQSLRAITPGSSAWYISGAQQSGLTAAPAGGINANFTVRNGLADPSCFTLESVAFPTWYLTRRATDVLLVQSDGSPAFRSDATWCTRLGLSGTGVSLESHAARGMFLRNDDQYLRLTNGSSSSGLNEACGFEHEVSWGVEGPGPTATYGWEDIFPPNCHLLHRGMEAGEVQPFRNLVDSGTPSGGRSGVGGIGDLTAPELFASTESALFGRSSLFYSGSDTSTTRSYAYMRAFDLSRSSREAILLTPTSRLTYWIYPQSSAQNSFVIGANSSCVAVELNGTLLRDRRILDSRGVAANPASQCGTLQLDQWNFVSIPLGSLAGTMVNKMSVGYDQAPQRGAYRGYVDDIVITS